MPLTIYSIPLSGVFVIEPRVFRDARGFFLESYHQRDLAAAGLNETFVQDNHSRSAHGVLRGLHYQDRTAPMGKMVRCTRGSIFDVAVDVRAGSPTFGQWFGVELTEDNFKQLWVPVGFAHGFVTLSEVADVQYKCTNFYTPAAEGSLRWDDPQIGIRWPVAAPILSARDQQARALADYVQAPAFHYAA